MLHAQCISIRTYDVKRVIVALYNPITHQQLQLHVHLDSTAILGQNDLQYCSNYIPTQRYIYGRMRQCSSTHAFVIPVPVSHFEREVSHSCIRTNFHKLAIVSRRSLSSALQDPCDPVLRLDHEKRTARISSPARGAERSEKCRMNTKEQRTRMLRRTCLGPLHPSIHPSVHVLLSPPDFRPHRPAYPSRPFGSLLCHCSRDRDDDRCRRVLEYASVGACLEDVAVQRRDGLLVDRVAGAEDGFGVGADTACGRATVRFLFGLWGRVWEGGRVGKRE